MNILWITNGLLPEATAKLGGSKELKGSGSWILALAEGIVKLPDVKLYIATVSNSNGQLVRIKGEKIDYYLIPGGRKGYYKVNHSIEPYWKEIKEEIRPDIIHIHGTEYTHGLAWLEACGAEKVCVSLQGLVSVIGKYYSYGLSLSEKRHARLHYLLFHRGICFGEKTFKERGECEEEILRRVQYVIGRTSWDKAHAWAINPKVKYYYGSEILRKEFYTDEKWNYNNCCKHSVFLSQGEYPLKGLLPVLRAMELVKCEFPGVTLRVAGRNILQASGIKDYLNNGDYRSIVMSLIKKIGLETHICFTGPLNAGEMKKEYLKANVFVCPSSIENSPNSLCEAQILGVPVIASYAGGIPDLMRGDEEHLFRFEEVEELAHKICGVFRKEERIEVSSMKETARMRHEPSRVINEIMSVYRDMIEGK